MKSVSRINFLEIFERINGVEDILKQDPAKQYDLMDANTKILYRNTIKELSRKTKLSEIYIAKKCLELSVKASENKNESDVKKEEHIGYYLISDGKSKLLNLLQGKNSKTMTSEEKARLYIGAIWIFTVIVDLLFSAILWRMVPNYKFVLSAIMFLIILLPTENAVTKIIQYVLSKVVKPKPIPKLDFGKGIPEECATMVVIPTILKNKDQVESLFKKLEVFYMANKSENLYFALLGDCAASSKELEEFDNEVIEEGIKCVKRLNSKYKEPEFYKFNFIYRKRLWNDKEGKFLGWERKRGLLNEFNEYVLGNIKNPFRINTMEADEKEIPKIKYIITLDSDTDLTLNSGLEMIGAMAHILNRPILNDKKDLVVSGHGIMAPRVGIGLEDTRKSIFTAIYAGQGGTDSYTNAISDLYQDNFDEGNYAGKGIYDIQVFSTVLNNEIKENTVLSHDLLEGCYLRAGYASDIMLMDGCPTNYISYKKRLYRWTRGDYQILLWLNNNIENKNGERKANPLGILSKYKIASNIFRSKQETDLLALIVYLVILSAVLKINVVPFLLFALVISSVALVLDFVNMVICKQENTIKTKSYTKRITGVKASFCRWFIDVMTLPDKAYSAIKAEFVTLRRMCRTKKNLLEWETSEEAEKNSKDSLKAYYSSMVANIVCGILGLLWSFCFNGGIQMFLIEISCLWLASPTIVYAVSKKRVKEPNISKVSDKDKQFLNDVAYKTWQYFKDNLNEKNNYLPPDNYQEDRKIKFVNRTSSTNIGLALLSVVASYDLKFETLENTIYLLDNMINTISKMRKWNGHLYNWYNIEGLEPLVPKYVSSVDSGNFVGYLYVLLQFLEEAKGKIISINEKTSKLDKVGRSIVKERNVGDEKTVLKIDTMISIVKKLIEDTDFSKLYDEKNRLFSVGYNAEEDKLTDSYYDLLASEARQTSLVAIAKKDVSPKHWNNLSRTLTSVNGYKGLVSWSGTAFEYLMPNVNIPNFEGSILDESCKFLIMSQKEYSAKLGVPWGFSEAAFNLKDLYNNYQYKAFGIPWLGLKRGLADEMVVSSYGTILAINEDTENVLENIKILKDYGMYNKYGFYESIDFTPTRVKDKYAVVKTYMAHHQALILLSINNLFNYNVLQKRFMENPEMQAIKILLEEKMPDNMVITKEEKEKVEKIKYVDYEDYSVRTYNKVDENLNISNVIANDDYTIVLDQYGNGYSHYKDIQINRFKNTDDEAQGMMFYIKDIKNNHIWTNTYSKKLAKPNKYKLSFSPDMSKITRVDGQTETVTKIIVDTDEPVEIRRLELKNTGITDQTLEVTSFFEPVLSSKEQDYAHKAFNNLFLSYEYLEGIDSLLIKRNVRNKDGAPVYMAVKLYAEENDKTDTEFEIDKEKFVGRDNFNVPKAVENSIPLRKRIENTIQPIVALKKIVTIKPGEVQAIDFLVSVSNDRADAIKNISKFLNNENIKRVFELSKARVEAESRYLGIKGKDIDVYQRCLSYLLFKSKVSIKNATSSDSYPVASLWKYGISGDLPILLVRIKDSNDIYIVKESINAYEYYRSKNIKIDLVILNEEKESYESFVKDAVLSVVLNKNLGYLFNIEGGIYLLNNINDKQDKRLLEDKAEVVLNGGAGSLKQQIDEMESIMKENIKQVGYEVKNEYYAYGHENYSNPEFNEDKLKYFNEYGGFSSDGKRYFIKVNKNEPLPTVWSHIIANSNFGTLVTESMGGFTWKNNSRLNKLTALSNDQVSDVPSEIIYLKDMESNKEWSLGLNPMPDENDYYVTYGFGYAEYLHVSSGVEQRLKVFVPQDDNVKVNVLHLENRMPESKNFKIVYYAKPVLEEDEIKSNSKIYLEYRNASNMIVLKNLANDGMKDKMFISSSEKIVSYTGSRASFLKNSDISNPDGLDQIELNRENSYGEDGIAAIELEVKIDALSSKDITIILGADGDYSKCQDIAYKYSDINNCNEELEKVKKYWEDLVCKVQVDTPIESTNIMLNGWLFYQTLMSRLYARTGFYQCGGAYGFRDQLQDVLAVKYFAPDITRSQILKHCAHQFVEGDVEHWWHDETSMGIRTRFSDDLLWLAYVTADYISFTQDYSILDEVVPYIDGEVLQDGVMEKYDLHNESSEKASVYEHCIRAIEHSLKFGENGLPLIGCGDWNDGLSNVGTQGKGESVWLGFFIYDVLKKFISICEFKQDINLAEKYKLIMENLKKALNTNGWDGRWYKRAFMDNGEVLGSLQNEECRIDGISQSWATISGAGDNDKKYISMESLENHLVDKSIGIIKLLDPPFEKGKLEPGYIKAYVPGTRENGGQYTHECCC